MVFKAFSRFKKHARRFKVCGEIHKNISSSKKSKNTFVLTVAIAQIITFFIMVNT